MTRSRPKQHKRRLRSGKVITVNRGRKKRRNRRYFTEEGYFKIMTDPSGKSDRKSKFYGCVRYQKTKGRKVRDPVALCGYIAARKKG